MAHEQSELDEGGDSCDQGLMCNDKHEAHIQSKLVWGHAFLTASLDTVM